MYALASLMPAPASQDAQEQLVAIMTAITGRSLASLMSAHSLQDAQEQNVAL